MDIAEFAVIVSIIGPILNLTIQIIRLIWDIHNKRK